MTLFSLLTENRNEILAKCRGKMAEVVGSRSSTYQLDQGLPTLYEELIEVLRVSLEDDSPEARQKFVRDTVTASASRQHAQESFRMGFTISQLVHGYGCICQGITEYAHEISAPISAAEFSQLNLCLDVAIAQAVSEFEDLRMESAGHAESLRMGFLLHELRNYLANAIMAHELIRRGGVGASGATSSVLTYAHKQMKDIVDRGLAEARLAIEPAIAAAKVNLFGLLSEVEGAALLDANAKCISLRVHADPGLDVSADRHLMASAVANLVQNAIKYTQEGKYVWIRAFSDGTNAVIEVEDQFGGLPEGKTEELFRPYVRGSTDQTGLGLGLSIARRAVELNGGKLTAKSNPGVGCVFTIRMTLTAPDLARAIH